MFGEGAGEGWGGEEVEVVAMGATRTDSELAEDLRSALADWEHRSYVKNAAWTAKNVRHKYRQITLIRSLLAGYAKWESFTEKQRMLVRKVIANTFKDNRR